MLSYPHLLLLFSFALLSCQQTLYAGPSSPRLRAGQELSPALKIGYVLGDSAKVLRLSDFKGKLLILDFWHTGCASCIASFPHMEKLQKMFGERIEILLVNPTETDQQIDTRLTNRFRRNKRLEEEWNNLSLSVVIASDELKDLLPPMGFPSHLWVDGTGVVRVFGSAINTHAKKIKEFLAGNPIKFIHASNTGIPYDFREPAFIRLPEETRMATQSSVVSGFAFEFSGYPKIKEAIIDTANATVRSTFINTELTMILGRVIGDRFNGLGWDRLVFSVNVARNSAHLDLIHLLVSDTLKYTKSFEPPAGLTDEHYIRSGYCYETIFPVDLSDSTRQHWMLADLNRFMESELKSRATIVFRKVPVIEISETGFTRANDKGFERQKIAVTLMHFFQINQADNIPLFFCKDKTMLSNRYNFPVWKAGQELGDLFDGMRGCGLDLRFTEIEVPILEVHML